MRQIYHKAHEVLSWVGSGALAGFPTEAVEYLVKKQSLGAKTTTVVSKVKDPQILLDDFASFDIATREEWRDNQSTIINAFFNQPYWKRVWIIQEITAAARVQIVWGDAEIPWEIVARALSTLRNNTIVVPRLKRAFVNAVHLLDFYELLVVKQEPLSLLKALSWSHHTLATDPRDKIFALLNLCHDGTRFVPVPNYKQPLSAIITDITVLMMRLNRSLELMCLKGTGAGISKAYTLDLPTWVPNLLDVWGSTMTIQETNFFKWQRVNSFIPVLEGSDNSVLKVKGKLLSSVTSLTSSISPDGIIRLPQKTRAPWITSTSDLSKQKPALYNASDFDRDRRDALYRTLTFCLLPETISYDCARKCFASLWTPEGRGAIHNLALIHWIDTNAWFQLEDYTLREWSQLTSEYDIRTSRVSDSDLSPASLSVFIGVLDKVLGTGMRLAALDGSQILGMVHPNAQEGDKIYLLWGCTIPVILRAVKGESKAQKYQVIGGAYTLGTDKKYYERYRPEYEIPQTDWNSDCHFLTLC